MIARLGLLLMVLGLVGPLRLLSIGSGCVQAQKPQLFSQYEDQLIQAALRQRGLTIDPTPAGKLIEEIIVSNHDIIMSGDLPLNSKLPWTLLNKVHVRTRDYIVAQELLIAVGMRYQRDLVEESERNLRAMFILSVARIVVAKGSTSERVRLLVVTKDRWTLRLNTTFLLDQTRLDQLAFSIAESNLIGRNKQLSFEFSLDPGRFALGASYYDPRVWSSRHSFRLYGLAYLNRDSRLVEGGLLQLTVGRPLFSLRTRLGWQANLNFLDDIARFFKGGEVAQRQYGSETVPDIYKRRQIVGNLQLTYSDGVVNKASVTVGLRASHVLYTLPENFPTVSDATRAAYVATLPRSESWAGPVVQFDLYTATYIKLKNINTFALTEDVRVGPRLNVEAKLASHVFGLPSDFVELTASFTHLRYFFDNLLDFGATVGGRVQYATAAAAGYTTPLVNQQVTAYLREISPRFGPLRLHVYGIVQLRARDLDHVRLTLGSDNGLRGFAPRALQGNSMYRLNVELRTLPLNLWTIHVGGVLFYDGGDAPPSWNLFDQSGTLLRAGYHQDAGVGLRILLPQFNRDVIRLDLGFPFELASGGGYAPRFSAEFAQAF